MVMMLLPLILNVQVFPAKRTFGYYVCVPIIQVICHGYEFLCR